MMALGLAIGAGFFLGTGSAIHQAGPAVIVSYALAAIIVVSVMLALAELASSLRRRDPSRPTPRPGSAGGQGLRSGGCTGSC